MKAIQFVSFILVGLAIAFLFFYPSLRLVIQGVDAAIFFDPSTLSIVRFTVFQATLSTLFSALIGLPIGLWVSRQRGLAYLLLAMPFAVPSLVAGISWIGLFGRSGILHDLEWGYSWKALVTAHVFLNAPWIALQMAQSRNQIPRTEIESAETLGANFLQRLTSIFYPRMKWDFLASLSQVFSFCVMSFALVLLLGGGPPVETLETSIYSSIRFGGFDLSSALSFAAWEVLLNMVPWVLILWAHGKTHQRLNTEASDSSLISRREKNFGIAVCGIFMAPYFVSVFHLNFSHFPEFIFSPDVRHAFWLSVKIATSSAIGAVLLCLAWIICIRTSPSKAFSRALEILASVPTSFSVFIFGLAFYLAYGRWINPFDGSLIAIVSVQIALFLPIAFRWLWPLSLNRNRDVYEAALSLGASPLYALCTAEWPKWRGPIFTVTAMIFGASLGELGAVSLFYAEKMIPLPLFISRLAEQYRFEDAESLAFVLLLLSLGAISVLFKFSNHQTTLKARTYEN